MTTEGRTGSSVRKIRTERHLGNESLKIRCHFIQRSATYSQVQGALGDFVEEQNTSRTRANFSPHPQPLIFREGCLLCTTPEIHQPGSGFKSSLTRLYNEKIELTPHDFLYRPQCGH